MSIILIVLERASQNYVRQRVTNIAATVKWLFGVREYARYNVIHVGNQQIIPALRPVLTFTKTKTKTHVLL